MRRVLFGTAARAASGDTPARAAPASAAKKPARRRSVTVENHVRAVFERALPARALLQGGGEAPSTGRNDRVHAVPPEGAAPRFPPGDGSDVVAPNREGIWVAAAVDEHAQIRALERQAAPREVFAQQTMGRTVVERGDRG